MSHKAEAVTCYKEYEAWLNMQHMAKLKWLQTDHSSKYLSHEFNTHLKAHGTVQSLAVHDTPEGNGMSEGLGCTLLKHAHVMLLAADLPKFLWAESVQHVTWLKNCMEKHHLKCCIRRSLTWKTYLSGAPTLLCSKKAAASSTKNWMKAVFKI